MFHIGFYRDKLANCPGCIPFSPNIKNSIHSHPFCWQASVFPTFSHLIVRRNNSITQRLQGQPSSACSKTLYNYQLSKYEKKPCQAFVYLWCRCGWAQWAGARYDWNVWIAVGCGHGVWRCPHSQRKGWTDCAPPPWTGLSPSPSPHLREGGGKDRKKAVERKNVRREEKKKEKRLMWWLSSFFFFFNEIGWSESRLLFVYWCVSVCLPPSLWNMATSRSVAPVWTMFCSRVWRAKRFSLTGSKQRSDYVSTHTHGKYTHTSQHK